jgi:biopolymer transport protein ExbD
MAEMNVIPLVDIMLVLLVIFIITAPVLTHAVKIDMPQASSELNEEDPNTITLAIDAQGQLHWNDQPMRFDELEPRLRQLTHSKPDTLVQLRADKQTPYELIARILATGSNAGIQGLGFVMEPE